jgi:hypothetical protein
MKAAIALFALVLGVLAATGAHAQSCRERQVQTGSLTVNALMLFDPDTTKLKGMQPVAGLKATIDVTDCGDAVYVMWDKGADTFLLMKSQVFPSNQSRPCACMSTGRGPGEPLGSPGAGDRNYCPAGEPKCVGR